MTLSKLLLAGYFGCGNLGDDSILLGFLDGIRSLGHDVTLLSGAPDDTYRNYRVSSVPRREMKDVQAEIAKCDALVFPGGSIFQDVTSVGSAMYYANLVKRAKVAGKKIILLGQGIGPLNTLIGRTVSVQAFNTADVVAVRDPASLNALRKLGVKTRVELTADPALLLAEPAASPDQVAFGVGSMRTIGLAPRPWGKNKETVQLFAEMARLLFKMNFMPMFIQMDLNLDGPLIAAIAAQVGGKVPDLMRLNHPVDIQQRMMRMDAVIAMRLHAGILATTVGVPAFMLSYDPKVSAFAKLMQMHEAPMVESMNAQRLFDQFERFLKDREANVRVLLHQRADLMPLARKNIEVLESVLSGQDARGHKKVAQ